VSHSDDAPHEEHEEHVNHEAWVIPYADLLTLLMAMFIALFAMSTVDMSKFKALSIGFNEALGGGKLDTGVFAGREGDSPIPGEGNGEGPGTGGTLMQTDGTVNNTTLAEVLAQRIDLQSAKAQEQESLRGVQERIEEHADAAGFAGNFQLRLEERGLVVTVITDQVLFDSGSAQLRPEGSRLLTVVGDALKDIDNPVIIEGHTDSMPISTAAYPSNWELSSGRAGAVARYFEALGLDRKRLRSEGVADLFPIESNATALGRARNRRVEIVVQSKLIDRALRQAGLAKTPVKPVTDPIDRPDSGIADITPDLGTPQG
jgi:chemotaxis protein MotB